MAIVSTRRTPAIVSEAALRTHFVLELHRVLLDDLCLWMWAGRLALPSLDAALEAVVLALDETRVPALESRRPHACLAGGGAGRAAHLASLARRAGLTWTIKCTASVTGTLFAAR